MADIFPDPPLSGPPEWVAWARELSGFLSVFVQTFNIPGLVTDVTATANSVATIVSWNSTKQAVRYRVHRNSTGDFATSQVLDEVAASKRGVRRLTYQDTADQDTPTRYYWITGINEMGREGPQSAMVSVTNYSNSGDDAFAIGVNAVASGDQAAAIGVEAEASGDQSIAIGVEAEASGEASTAIGFQAQATAAQALAIGTLSEVTATLATGVGYGALVSHTLGAAFGTSANVQATGGTAVGAAAGIPLLFDYSMALGYASVVTDSHQLWVGGSDVDVLSPGYLEEMHARIGINNQAYLPWVTLTELTTIAAGATTDTAIQIPANVVVLAVAVRVTVVIPTAATFTVTGTSSGTTFNTAAVSTAANTTNKGNVAGAFYNATAQTIRITPNAIPAANTGRVRVVIIYADVSPPAS